MPLKEMFVVYTELDNGYLVFIPNAQRLMAVRDVVIEESEVNLFPHNTERGDLLDEGLRNWGSGTQTMVLKAMAT